MLTLCATQAAAAVQSAVRRAAAWDRKFELSSRGAHLFKEFFTAGARRFPSVYAVPFNYLTPLTTPSGFAIANATVATALVGALTAAGDEDHAPRASRSTRRSAWSSSPCRPRSPAAR